MVDGGGGIVVRVRNESDIVEARQIGREMAGQLGFSATERTLIATAISEVARNIVAYAGTGEIELQAVQEAGRQGISIVARDEGPGIADIALAMTDGYSTGNSLGMGLPGAKRLMDELDVESQLDVGTTISMRKWV